MTRYAMSPLPPPLVVTETRLGLAARRPPPQPANKRPAAGLRTRRDPGTSFIVMSRHWQLALTIGGLLA